MKLELVSGREPRQDSGLSTSLIRPLEAIQLCNISSGRAGARESGLGLSDLRRWRRHGRNLQIARRRLNSDSEPAQGADGGS